MPDRGAPDVGAGESAGAVSPTRPLAGRSVVVTRSRDQASTLVERLSALGASVVELPVIAVEAPTDGGAALAAAADRLVDGRYGWVAVTSSNGARAVVAALGGRRPPPEVSWAAVGPGTSRALADAGFAPDLVPPTSVAEALADAFPDPRPARTEVIGAGARAAPWRSVLFPRAEVVRGALVAGLRAKGWEVDEVVAYRTVAGRPDAAALAAAARADAVAFTSSSTVDRTVALLGPGIVPPVVASIGPITSASARDAGLDVAVEAAEHTIDGLVAALVEVLGAPSPGRT